MRAPQDQFHADFRWLSFQCDLVAGEAAQLFSHLNAEQADDIARTFVEGLGKVYKGDGVSGRRILGSGARIAKSNASWPSTPRGARSST